MAGIWSRIQNVWSNELWTSEEAQSSARVAVEDARTDMAQGLVRIMTDPELRAALRETAIQLGAAEIPVIAAAEQMSALQREPESLGVSAWLNGYASEIQYEIGRSKDGYHFRTETSSTEERLGFVDRIAVGTEEDLDGFGIGEEEVTTRSEWSLAYPTPHAAEAAAQAAMAEWARADAALEQEARAGEQVEEPAIVYSSEWISGFGSEFQYFIGQSEEGFHCFTQVSDGGGEPSTSGWSAPVPTREEAERLGEGRREAWDERVGAREIEHEEREIARFERSRGMSVEV